MSQIIPTRSILLSNPIISETGFINVKIKTVEIVNQTITVLHMINPNDFSTVIEDIESNMMNMKIPPNGLIEKQIQILKSRLKSINSLSRNIRKKRGLLNIVGSAQKWLFGTMDNDDRTDILNHLDIITTNSHNAIEGLNKQIVINDHFQDSINLLKSIIRSDRNMTKSVVNDLKSENGRIITRLYYSDILFKLKFIEDRINQIQDSIASAKNHILHPSILTSDEIVNYDIDFHKLQLTKLDALYYKDNFLVIAIKIPLDFFKTDLRLMLPMPNSKFLEIDSDKEYFITVNNIQYKYEENKSLKYLQRSSRCTLYSNCKLKYNDLFNIITIDEETVIIKNAKNQEIIQNCDDRHILINGNHILSFYDCEIKIDYNVFTNKNEIVFDKYVYDDNVTYNFTENISLNYKGLSNNSFHNLNEIKELKMHKNISYGINISIMIIFIIIVSVLMFIIKKNQIKIKINETPPQVVEVMQRYEENV